MVTNTRNEHREKINVTVSTYLLDSMQHIRHLNEYEHTEKE